MVDEMAGKCPKCEKLLYSIRFEPIEITTGTSTAYKGNAYICSSCSNIIISVQMDPIAIRSKALTRIEELIKKWK